MRKTVALIGLLILIAVPSVLAQPGLKLGVGAFAGISYPVIQKDQGQGSEFGFKGRCGVGSLLTLEPYVSFVKWGKPGTLDGVDLGIDGSKVTSFGVEALLGNLPGAAGISPYFMIGGGSYKVKNDATSYESSKLGWDVGLGVGVGLARGIGLDVRGKAIIAPQENGGSKKAVGAVAGINYSFGPK
jgi:hypothetical protein